MQPKNINNIKMDVKLTDKIVAGEIINREEAGSRLSCHKIFIPPNAAYPPHEHPSEHVILILEGNGYARYWQDDKEHYFELIAGDMFFVPQNAPHQVGAFGNGATMIAISTDSKPLHDPERMIVLRK